MAGLVKTSKLLKMVFWKKQRIAGPTKRMKWKMRLNEPPISTYVLKMKIISSTIFGNINFPIFNCQYHHRHYLGYRRPLCVNLKYFLKKKTISLCLPKRLKHIFSLIWRVIIVPNTTKSWDGNKNLKTFSNIAIWTIMFPLTKHSHQSAACYEYWLNLGYQWNKTEWKMRESFNITELSS